MFWSGFVVTLELSALAVVCSFPLGLVGALARTSPRRLTRVVVGAYVEIVRNVPLLVIIYIVFYGLPSFGLHFGTFASGVIALVLNSTAFTVEIFRGGLAAIPHGQYEAGESLGMRRWQVLRDIVVPQLLRVAFPALGNQVVFVILGSSLIEVIGGLELTGVSYEIGSLTYRFFEVFAVAAVLYFVAVQLLLRVWSFVGNRWLAADFTVRG